MGCICNGAALGAAWHAEGRGRMQGAVERILTGRRARQGNCRLWAREGGHHIMELPSGPQVSGAGRSTPCGGWRPHANYDNERMSFEFRAHEVRIQIARGPNSRPHPTLAGLRPGPAVAEVVFRLRETLLFGEKSCLAYAASPDPGRAPARAWSGRSRVAPHPKEG